MCPVCCCLPLGPSPHPPLSLQPFFLPNSGRPASFCRCLASLFLNRVCPAALAQRNKHLRSCRRKLTLVVRRVAVRTVISRAGQDAPNISFLFPPSGGREQRRFWKTSLCPLAVSPVLLLFLLSLTCPVVLQFSSGCPLVVLRLSSRCEKVRQQGFGCTCLGPAS